MSEFFSPNFSIGAAWRSTVTNITTQLRQIKFAVEGTFSFGNFDPAPNWSGMTTSAYSIGGCRYLRIGKLFFFTLSVSVTLAAPLSNVVTFTLPASIVSSSLMDQAGGAVINNTASAMAGAWYVPANSNKMYFYLANTAAYTAAASVFRATGFFEVN